MWLLDSFASLPNTTEDIRDAILSHSLVPRYRPLRQPTTRQPNDEFNHSRWDIGWHDCHFVSKLKFHSDSTQLNLFDTNAILFLEQLEKSILVMNELIGAGRNFGRGWGSFENCRGGGGHSDEIKIDFYRLRGKTDALVGRFHTIGEQWVKNAVEM